MKSIQLAQLQENIADSLTQIDNDDFSRFLDCSCRVIGIVKWYDRTKKYGFIRSMVNGDELFVHCRDLNTKSATDRFLVAGEYVEYEKICVDGQPRTDKNEFKAINVKGVCGGPLMCETNADRVPSKFTPLDNVNGAYGHPTRRSRNTGV